MPQGWPFDANDWAMFSQWAQGGSQREIAERFDSTKWKVRRRVTEWRLAYNCDDLNTRKPGPTKQAQQNGGTAKAINEDIEVLDRKIDEARRTGANIARANNTLELLLDASAAPTVIAALEPLDLFRAIRLVTQALETQAKTMDRLAGIANPDRGTIWGPGGDPGGEEHHVDPAILAGLTGGETDQEFLDALEAVENSYLAEMGDVIDIHQAPPEDEDGD